MITPFLQFNVVNPLTFWGPNLIGLNIYIFSLMVAEKTLYTVAAWLIFRYLKKFYGGRPVPREWKIFWWSFIFYSLHEVIELVMIYQWIQGRLFWLSLFIIEITAASLLTWACYLLAKTYAFKE